MKPQHKKNTEHGHEDTSNHSETEELIEVIDHKGEVVKKMQRKKKQQHLMQKGVKNNAHIGVLDPEDGLEISEIHDESEPHQQKLHLKEKHPKKGKLTKKVMKKKDKNNSK